MLAVLAMVAGLVLPMVGGVVDSASTAVTNAHLAQVRTAVDRYAADMSLTVVGPLPGAAPTEVAAGRRLAYPQLRYVYVNPLREPATNATELTLLTFDPTTQVGWRGPYLSGGQSRFSAANDRTGDARLTAAERGFFPVGQALYGQPGDPTILDGWGQPIVLQAPNDDPATAVREDRVELRAVSAGPDGVLDIQPTWTRLQVEAARSNGVDDLVVDGFQAR